MTRKPVVKKKSGVTRGPRPKSGDDFIPPAIKQPKGWQVGNSFWKARATHGREKIFSSPEFFAEACQEYFDWVEEHPLQEAKAFAYEGDVTIEAIPKMRAMTLGSLQLFLGITDTTWYEYKKRNDFAGVCMMAEKVIREQKFGGAASGLLNHAIIARDLGLADKREYSGPGGGPIRQITTEMSAQEAAAAYADTLRDEETDEDN